jgi:pilus assembly protein CpaB
MVLRIAFFALMALGLLGLGFIAYASTRSPHEANGAPPPTVNVHVLTAAKEILAGSLLKPGDLSSKEVSINAVPAGATMDNDDERRGLIGAMMRRSLTAGEAIHLTDALRPGDHGFLAAVLKGDMRAVTVAIDATTGTAGLIWPGDRVDLILTQTINDPALPAGRRVVAETVVSDSRVIAIDQRMVEGAANSAASPALSVRPADSQPDAPNARNGSTTTFASDVSRALSGDLAPPVPAAQSIKIWSGTGEAKDFKF